jgi:CRISPR-associated protein (TIGR02584 family)
LPPPDAPIRTLVISLGLSPQVVTETLWALVVDAEPAWAPDEIVLVTTSQGARSAEATLLDGGEGRIRALGREYGRDDLERLADKVRIERIGEDGARFDDVDTEPAHAATADRTMRLIRDLTADGRRQIHASIAGGRKSQGALLALSMSLFARPGDCLSHILVDDDFAGRPDFFFPPAQPATLVGHRGETLNSAAARVRLSQIPFPRIRALLPEETRDAEHFADAILGVQRRLDPPTLTLVPSRREAIVAGTALDLKPSQFAWLAALASDRSNGGAGLPRTGLAGATVERWRPIGPKLPDVVDAETVEEWTSRLNKLVRVDVPALWGQRLIVTAGRRPRTRYRLMIEPEYIFWQEP